MPLRSAAELQGFYQSALLPVLQQMESERLRVRNGLITLWVIAGAVLVFGSLLLIFLLPVIGHIILLVIFFIAVAWGGHKIRGSFRSDFKHRIIGPIVKFADPGLAYAPESGIACGEYQGGKIFLTGVDRYQCEDLVQGVIGRTAIRFSEVHSEYKTETTDKDGHRHTHWHTIFRGLYFIADFNKSFNGEYVVLTDTAERLFGRLGQNLQSMTMGRPPLVKMEDPEFEKLFVVYGTDQVEARYLLTPSFMARLTNYRKQSNREIQLGFSHSHLYLAVSYPKNLFEPRLFSTLLDFTPIREYYADLAIAVDLVEELNLNTRIWGK